MALVSATQISSNARLAFGCWLFGNFASTFATVLCTQQRCSRVSARPHRRISRPERAIGDDEPRRHLEPAPLQVEQQIALVARFIQIEG